MSRNIFNKICLAAVVLAVSCLNASAQADTGFTPYSIFGVGDLMQPGTAYNQSMAGVGIAGRNNRFINILNPAAVTARDSLAFMSDFSVYSDNKIFRQGDMRTGDNTVNINDCVVSFPIWKSSAMMVGIMPYSSTGYGYYFDYTDPEIIGRTGNISYSSNGHGSMYQLFAAAGATFFKRISIGAEAIYYFGNMQKNFYGTFTNASYNAVSNGYNIQLNAFAGKFGIQYDQPVGNKGTICIGATYKTDASLGGFVEDYSYSVGPAVTDTLHHRIDTLGRNQGRVKLAGELGVGVAFRYADKLSVEFDYTRSDWTESGFEKFPGFSVNTNSRTNGYSSFSSCVTESFRLGMEYVPNRNDIRYYMRRVAYRAGAYYKKDYFKVDGHDIISAGITLGATFPVFRWYNGLTVGVELGRRGTTAGNLVSETYCNISVGMNLFDIWFQQPRYE